VSTKRLSRRGFLRMSALTTASAVLAACQPQVVKETVEIEKEVEVTRQVEIEKEVEVTRQVEVEKTVIVEATAEAAPSEPVTVEYWHSHGPDHPFCEIHENLAALFMEQSPQITIDILCGQAEDAFLTAYAGGMPPDVMYINSPGDMAARGAVVPLDSYIALTSVDLEQWPDVWKRRSEWEGKIYGLSMTNLSTNMAFSWNKRLFEEADLDPESPPKTWAEAEEYSKLLTKFDDAGNIVQVGWDTTDAVGTDPTTWSSVAGFELYDMYTHQWQFDRPEMVAAMDFCARVKRDAGAEAMTAFRTQYGTWTGSPDSSFPKGVQAMIVNGAWQPGELQTTATPDLGEIGYGYCPTPDEPRKVQFSGGQSYAMVTGTDVPDASWKFLEMLISDVAQLLWIDAGQFQFGSHVREEMRAKAQEVPGLEFFVDLLEEIEAGEVEFYWAPPVPGLGTMYQHWVPSIDEVMFGEISAEEGCARVQEEVQKVHDEALRQF
jgi:multiple sugar transport system substrate-binding protein